MKPFPQMPALPAIPSLPSLKDLIDTSPQVFYPSSQITDRPRSRHGAESSSSSSRNRFPTPEHPHQHQPHPHSQHHSHSHSISFAPTVPRTDLKRGRTSDRTLSPSHRSRSRSTTAADSPRKRQSSFNFTGEHRPRGIGLLAGGSASATDLTGEWEPLAAPPAGHAGLYRSDSLPGKHTHLAACHTAPGSPVRPAPTQAAGGLRSPSPAGSPAKPAHRRTQSVSAFPAGLRKPPVPLGRLTEYSRNPLASTSAISLPTLAEDNADPSDSSVSQSGTPILRAGEGRRRSSKTSIISPLGSPTTAGAMSPPRIVPHLSLPFDESEPDGSVIEEDESDGSVPPPQDRLDRFSRQGTSLAVRPPMSPRSRSTHDVPRVRHIHSHSIASLPSSRRSSASGSPVVSPSFRLSFSPSLSYSPSMTSVSMASAAETSISDVAVLATWSFPPSPPKSESSTAPSVATGTPGDGAHARVRVVSGSSERLKERLRTLSLLDTSSAPSSGSNTPTNAHTPLSRFSTSTPTGLLPPAQLHRSSTNVHPRSHRPRLASHRHSLSSPSGCLPTTLERDSHHFPSPPGPLARPAHGHQPQAHQNRHRPFQTSSLSIGIMAPPPPPSSFPTRTKLSRTLSSSPGSMTSSSSTCPSPTGSVASLPPLVLAHHRAPLVRTRTMDSELLLRGNEENRPSTPESKEEGGGGGGGGGGGWWKWPRRSSSTNILTENVTSANTTPKANRRAVAPGSGTGRGMGMIVNVREDDDGLPLSPSLGSAKLRAAGGLGLGLGEEGDRSLEEEFIDFDDM